MIEGALVSSIALAILFGIIEFGQAVWSYNLISHAAREGTRYAIVHGRNSITPATTSTIQGIVRNQTLGLNPNNLTVTTTWTPDNKPGSVVKVALVYTFKFMGPYVPTGTYTMRSSSQVTISN